MSKLQTSVPVQPALVMGSQFVVVALPMVSRPASASPPSTPVKVTQDPFEGGVEGTVNVKLAEAPPTPLPIRRRPRRRRCHRAPVLPVLAVPAEPVLAVPAEPVLAVPVPALAVVCVPVVPAVVAPPPVLLEHPIHAATKPAATMLVTK